MEIRALFCYICSWKTLGDTYTIAAKTNMVADLSKAAAATVNQFIEAYNLQQLLMRDIKGTRYYEVIQNHYGIQNDDIRLYIPELLSIRRFKINVSPVVQQSGATAATSSFCVLVIEGSLGNFKLSLGSFIIKTIPNK